MGWTGIYKHDCVTNRRGNIDKRATLVNELSDAHHGFVKASMAGGNLYGIYFYEHEGVTRYCLAVVLTRYEDDMLWYKEMDDTWGPVCHDCPKTVLDLADEMCPVTDEYDPHGYARAWRDRCREALANKSNPCSFTKLSYGDSVRWHVPVGVGWSEDIEGRTLVLTKVRGKRCWVCYGLWMGFKTRSVDPNDCELIEETMVA